MSMGIPVLHGVEGESAEIVKKHRIGIVFTPEDAQELALHIQELSKDPETCKNLSEKAKENVWRFDRKELAVRMLKKIENLE